MTDETKNNSIESAAQPIATPSTPKILKKRAEVTPKMLDEARAWFSNLADEQRKALQMAFQGILKERRGRVVKASLLGGKLQDALKAAGFSDGGFGMNNRGALLDSGVFGGSEGIVFDAEKKTYALTDELQQQLSEAAKTHEQVQASEAAAVVEAPVDEESASQEPTPEVQRSEEVKMVRSESARVEPSKRREILSVDELREIAADVADAASDVGFAPRELLGAVRLSLREMRAKADLAKLENLIGDGNLADGKSLFYVGGKYRSFDGMESLRRGQKWMDSYYGPVHRLVKDGEGYPMLLRDQSEARKRAIAEHRRRKAGELPEELQPRRRGPREKTEFEKTIEAARLEYRAKRKQLEEELARSKKAKANKQGGRRAGGPKGGKLRSSATSETSTEREARLLAAEQSLLDSKVQAIRDIPKNSRSLDQDLEYLSLRYDQIADGYNLIEKSGTIKNTEQRAQLLILIIAATQRLIGEVSELYDRLASSENKLDQRTVVRLRDGIFRQLFGSEGTLRWLSAQAENILNPEYLTEEDFSKLQTLLGRIELDLDGFERRYSLLFPDAAPRAALARVEPRLVMPTEEKPDAVGNFLSAAKIVPAPQQTLRALETAAREPITQENAASRLPAIVTESRELLVGIADTAKMEDAASKRLMDGLRELAAAAGFVASANPLLKVLRAKIGLYEKRGAMPAKADIEKVLNAFS